MLKRIAHAVLAAAFLLPFCAQAEEGYTWQQFTDDLNAFNKSMEDLEQSRTERRSGNSSYDDNPWASVPDSENRSAEDPQGFKPIELHNGTGGDTSSRGAGEALDWGMRTTDKPRTFVTGRDEYVPKDDRSVMNPKGFEPIQLRNGMGGGRASNADALDWQMQTTNKPRTFVTGD